MTTKQTEALKQAQAALRGLTFKDSAITAALEAIHRALEAPPTQDIHGYYESTWGAINRAASAGRLD